MNKKDLSERDICTKFITPALIRAAWEQHQFREEVNLTKGRVMVRGKLAYRITQREAPVRLVEESAECLVIFVVVFGVRAKDGQELQELQDFDLGVLFHGGFLFSV